MKVLLFSDPHITLRGEFSQPTSDGLSDYMHRVIESFDWVNQMIVEHRPNLVACLGDITETTGYIDTTSLKVAVQLFSKLSVTCYGINSDLVCLVGNHDSYSTINNIHNLEFLKTLDGLTVVDAPRFVNYDKCKILFVPWVDKEYVLDIPSDTDLVLTHFDVKGGFLFKTKKSSTGVDPTLIDCQVFNGHQHAGSMVTDKWCNVGSLVSRNFHDVDSPTSKSIILYDTDTKDIVRLNNPHDRPFVDIVVSNDDDRDRLVDYIDRDFTGYTNSYARIKCSERYRDLAEQFGCLTASSRIELIPTTKSGDTVTEILPSSPDESFRDYVTSLGLTDDVHTEVLRLGLEYLSKAKVSDTQHTFPLKFLSVHAVNFQCLGDVTIKLDTAGLYCVEGRNEDDPADSNGSGKSTIPEAIYWCTTGKSLRKYTGDEVIQWGKDFTEVSEEFMINDKTYTLIRSRRHPEYGTGVRLFEGDTDISARLSGDTDNVIARLLGRSEKVLQQSVFLTSGLSNRFTSLSYPERVRVIEQVANLGIYTAALSYATDYYNSSLNDQFVAKGKMSQSEAAFEAAKARLDHLTVKLEKLQDDVGPQLAKYKKLISTSKERIGVVGQSITELDLSLSEVSNKILIVSSKLTKLSSPILSATSEVSKVKSAIDIKSRLVREMELRVSKGECTVCGQTIGKDAPIVVSLNELVEEVASLKSSLTTSSIELDKLLSSTSSLHKLDSKLKEQRSEIIDNKNSLVSDKRILENEYNASKTNIDNIRSSVSDLSIRIAESKANADSAELMISESRDVLLNADKVVEVASCLKSVFSTTGLRAKVLFDTVLPFMNKRVEEYSLAMGRYCSLDYKRKKSGALDDKIEILQPDDQSYKGNSSGEKRKVDLAIQCALNDLSLSTGGSHINLLICDEVIDPLDDTGLHSFIDILKSKSEDTTILLMAHRPFFDSLIPNKLTIVKRGGVSFMEQP